MQMKLGKKNYWKNRSRNFENLYNELAVMVKSQPPQSQIVRQVKDRMAKNNTYQGEYETEYNTYV